MSHHPSGPAPMMEYAPMPQYGYYPFAPQDAPLYPASDLMAVPYSSCFSATSAATTVTTAPSASLPVGPSLSISTGSTQSSRAPSPSASSSPSSSSSSSSSSHHSHNHSHSHKAAALEAAAVSPVQFGGPSPSAGPAHPAFDFTFHIPAATDYALPTARPARPGVRVSVSPALPPLDTSPSSGSCTTTPSPASVACSPSAFRAPGPDRAERTDKAGTSTTISGTSGNLIGRSSHLPSYAATPTPKHPADGPSDRASKRARRASPPPITSADLSAEDRLLIKLKDDDNLAWKEIAARFRSDLGKSFQVPALQMRLKRLRERMRTWSESDVAALRLAHAFWESHKFDIIADKMAEFGARDRWTGKQCARKWESLGGGGAGAGAGAGDIAVAGAAPLAPEIGVSAMGPGHAVVATPALAPPFDDPVGTAFVGGMMAEMDCGLGLGLGLCPAPPQQHQNHQQQQQQPFSIAASAAAAAAAAAAAGYIHHLGPGYHGHGGEHGPAFGYIAAPGPGRYSPVPMH